MKNLSDMVREYFKHRNYVVPDATQALHFLVSEVGELSDAHVHQQAEWVRNNPGRRREVGEEIGDVLMMLTAYAIAQGIDPVEALAEKMKKHGFSP